MKKRLGEVLIDAGMINETQLSTALQSQKAWGGKMGSTLVRMGFVREEDILRALSSQMLLPAVDFNKVKVSPRALKVLPQRIAEKYTVIPVALREDQGHKQLVLVMSDPTNLEALSEIEFQTGCRIRPAVATDSAITRAIDFYYSKTSGDDKEALSSPSMVGLAEVDESEPMELVSEHHGGHGPDPAGLESLGTGQLLKLLIRVLVRKNIINKADIANEFRRRKST